MQSKRSSPFLHPPRPSITSQPAVPNSLPLEPTAPIASIEPSTSHLLQDPNLFSYEWNIFEQSLEWAHQDSLDWFSESVLSTSPSSPADSTNNSFSPQNTHSLSQSQSQSPASNPKLPLPKAPASTKTKPRRRQQSPESRARRRSQNREAQRAFRTRKQQVVEEMQVELSNMASKYEGLQEKYENLSKLYMDLLKQKGTPVSGIIEGEFLPDWRPEEGLGVGGGEMREGLGESVGEMQILGQEFDVDKLLFGPGTMAVEGLRDV